MKTSNAALAIAAFAIATIPSLAAGRSSAPVEGDSHLAGTSLIVVAVGVAAILVGMFVILEDDDDPLSP